jgi:hypothetical protein
VRTPDLSYSADRGCEKTPQIVAFLMTRFGLRTMERRRLAAVVLKDRLDGS